MLNVMVRMALLAASALRGVGLSVMQKQRPELENLQSTRLTRFNLTQDEIGNSFINPPAALDWANTPGQIFNMDNWMDVLTQKGVKEVVQGPCPLPSDGSRFDEDHVAGLFPARSGSLSLSAVIDRRLSQRQPHHHGCTLKDVRAAGARHVLVTLSPVLNRLMSTWKGFPGFMGHLPTGKFAGDDDFDTFLTALRDVEDPLHSAAMRQSLACKAFWPVYEFYLEGSDAPADTDVKFVCVCTLNEDVQKAFDEWGIQDKPDVDVYSHKASAKNPKVSAENQQWLERVYRKDYSLWNKHCRQCL